METKSSLLILIKIYINLKIENNNNLPNQHKNLIIDLKG